MQILPTKWQVQRYDLKIPDLVKKMNVFSKKVSLIYKNKNDKKIFLIMNQIMLV